jgi:hypothetical protein
MSVVAAVAAVAAFAPLASLSALTFTVRKAGSAQDGGHEPHYALVWTEAKNWRRAVCRRAVAFRATRNEENPALCPVASTFL